TDLELNSNMKKLLILPIILAWAIVLWGQDSEPVFLKTYTQTWETRLKQHLDGIEGIRKIDVIQGTNYFFHAIDLFANQCKNGPFTKYDKLKKKEKAAYLTLNGLIDEYLKGQLQDKDVLARLQLFFKEHQFKAKVPKPNLHATGIYPYHQDYQAQFSI